MQEEGVPVVDADVIARRVVEPGRRAWRQIRETFGPEVFQESGELDRARLAKLVFSDPERRRQLNRITHGQIQLLMIWETLKLFFQGHSFAILDLPLLFESGVAVDCMEKIVVVSCIEEVQLERLLARSGEPEEDCRRRIQSQMPLATKLQHANVVVENSGGRAATAEQVRCVLSVLRTSRAHWRVRAVLVLLVGGVLTLLTWLVMRRWS